jgi:hypothetical protein
MRLLAILTFCLLQFTGIARAELLCNSHGAGARACTAGLSSAIASEMVIAQEKSKWCWAAALAMLFQRYGYVVPQDQIVTRWLGDTVDRGLPNAELPDLLSLRWRDRGGRTTPQFVPSRIARTDLNEASTALTILASLGRGNPVVLSASGHAVLLVALSFVEEKGSASPVIVGGMVIDPAPGRGLRSLESHEMLPASLVYVEAVGKTPALASSRKGARPQRVAV